VRLRLLLVEQLAALLKLLQLLPLLELPLPV